LFIVLQLGSIVVPRLVTPWPTYTTLFLLVALHLGINYLGVRGLILHTLNRQRVALAWASYRSSNNTTVPNPKDISQAERILAHPGVFRDAQGRVTGTCTIGLPFFDAFSGHFPSGLFEHFEEERYLLWYDTRCLRSVRDGTGHTIHGPVNLHIILKDGYTVNDQLKAWIHAVELCSIIAHGRQEISKGAITANPEAKEALALIRSSHERIDQYFPDFIARMRAAGWNTVDGVLMPGSPKGVVMGVDNGTVADGKDGVEEKKVR
jgi:Vitamin B6 photo-protection and homoeostasis